MRTIKFRGKKEETGEWVYGFFAFLHMSDSNDSDQITRGITSIPSILNDDYGRSKNCWNTVVQKTVGQFTGLKDSEGQEIYEGDILTWRSIICEEDPVETWELPVTFYNGCFCLNDDFDMTLISVIYDSEEFGGVKIIGNIHDNP